LWETEACLLDYLSSTKRACLSDRVRKSEGILAGRETVLCHGDAWYGNALVDEGHLLALLDFEDACVADPALDLAATMHLSPPGAELVLDSYLKERPTTPLLPARMESYLLVRELADSPMWCATPSMGNWRRRSASSRRF
jgi:aminoglycoside phosphotransferase (APT) family kinase protein